jgi:hypothetical protein
MENALPWIGLLTTIAGIVVGAIMVIWQLRAGLRAEIKRKTYEELRDAIDEADDAVQETANYIFGMPTHVEMYRQAVKLGRSPIPAFHRFPKMLDLCSKEADKVCLFLRKMKAHFIVSEHFELFHQAITCAQHDLLDAYKALIPAAARVLPMDPPPPNSEGLQTIVPNSTDAEVEAMRQIAVNHWEALQMVGSFLEDVIVEAQNLLMADSMGRKIPPRRPADHRLWVLRTDDPVYLRKLRKHFFEDHPAAVRHRNAGVDAATSALSSDIGDPK